MTKLFQMRITEVGPRRGSAFGGTHTIQLVGCWQQTKPDEKDRNGIRSAKVSQYKIICSKFIKLAQQGWDTDHKQEVCKR